ncbi:PR domain zinc finger protein 2 [Larimichthys crocea]|uniref:PR domain zinc finger protein 2 n=1 Tax=Larimichthys crocea TaxID=215358 RepID=A0A6G0J4N1_LARCR|nr:PR domain zinc finger protein 2 [Larimichthys crocea]
MLLQEASVKQQQQPDESPSTSPPTVYVPSADTEDEADRDDYTVDISKNISENLSFYIDGKIVSTSSVSTCEVIEVDSRSAALFGLDTVIISPNQISQALKVEARTSAAKQASTIGQPAGKRRTSTPPLVPSLKVETETASSSSSSSSTSSSSNLLVGGLFQQAADSSAFQREKTVYLSPKLKQLLQTQDIQKSAITLITESHRLASPLSVTPLPGASGRFKRRTASPPSSPQLSPACKTESCKAEVVSSYALKVPKLENRSVSPLGSLHDKEDSDSQSLSGNNTHGQTSSNSGGNSCNQQPLDLSNSVSRKCDSLNKVHGDSALDLSLHRKSSIEPELKGSPAPQPLTKKKKPNTSMLEKVLMNEYVGLGEEGPAVLANLSCFHSRSPNVASESAHPSPPSLTPVTMNPSSPSASSVTSPTPPPPVLPTIPSPPTMPSSPLSQPSDSAALRPLPVLSPKMSPRSMEHKSLSDSEEILSAEENGEEEESHNPEPLDSPKTSLEDPLNFSVTSSPPESVSSAPDKPSDKTSEAEDVDSSYCKTFVCNVCEDPFNSIKELSGHITEHAADWPFKCEFCVQLFGDAPALLTHRTTLHGVGRIFVCSVCSKEFAFLCNLQQHQKDLHPNETCSHTTVESGKLRPQNYTDPSRAKEESSPSSPAPEMTDEAAPHNDSDLAKEEPDLNAVPMLHLWPPLTNFTTHNIPQTFSTAIRCTKCGNSFDNMPELHQHILACANASDKKRYTPKKNPIPLKQIVKSPNGVVSPSAATAGQSAFRRMGQPKRLNFNQDTGKTKMSALDREFTYPASLSKHMVFSCPMKPVVKKGKKGLAEVKKEDRNTNLRKKALDYDIQQRETEQKPLGKTRARSSGASDPEPSQPSKGKTAATLGRLKRPASFPAPVSVSKKTKKGHVQSLPPTPSALDTPSDTAQQRPAIRMQRMGKEAAPKRLAEAKSPPSQQLKKEERFSLRTRDRVGGPVTRSLQMANAAPSAEVKTEDPPIQEPKETQEVLMK